MRVLTESASCRLSHANFFVSSWELRNGVGSWTEVALLASVGVSFSSVDGAVKAGDSQSMQAARDFPFSISTGRRLWPLMATYFVKRRHGCGCYVNLRPRQHLHLLDCGGPHLDESEMIVF